eukprot:1860398-Amphidinium_carterae.1
MPCLFFYVYICSSFSVCLCAPEQRLAACSTEENNAYQYRSAHNKSCRTNKRKKRLVDTFIQERENPES